MKVGFWADWRATLGGTEVKVVEGTPPTRVPRLTRFVTLVICEKTGIDKKEEESYEPEEQASLES